MTSVNSFRLRNTILVLWVFVFIGQIFVGTSACLADDSNTNMGHEDADKILVAKVNGVQITMANLMDKMFELAQRKYGKKEISPLVATKIKNDAMAELVKEELAYQKAHAVIGDISKDEIDKAIGELTANYGGEKKFKEFLQKTKTGIAEYRHKVARALTVKLFIKRDIEDKITVNDQEIKAAYEGAKDKYFVQHEQVQVTDITLFIDPNLPGAIAEAEAFKEKIIKKFNNDPFTVPKDASFALMKNVTLNKIKSPKRYEAARKLGKLGVSAPLNVDGTLHLVQLTGYKPEISKSLKDARKYLTRELKKKKTQAAIRNWVKNLKKGAKIEIMDFEV